MHTLTRAARLALCLTLILGLAACGDDASDSDGGSTSTNSGTTSTNSGTTSTNNATTSTNNATTSTNNSTTSTNNSTTSTNNGTTSTNNAAFDACVAVCEQIAACPELAETCSPELAEGLRQACSVDICVNPEDQAQVAALEGVPCATVVPLVIDQLDPEAQALCDDGGGVTVPVGECAPFEACEGGDLTGRWRMEELCLDVEIDDPPPEDPIPECDGEAFDFEIGLDGGSLDVREDGTYTLEFETFARLEFNIPEDCLPPETACEAFADNLNADNEDNGTWICGPPEGGICGCRVINGDGDREIQSGAWRQEGGLIVLEPDNPDDDAFAFETCATGDTLSLYTQDPNSDFDLQLEFVRPNPSVPVGACGDFEACGGAFEGAWSISEFCTEIEGAPEDPIPSCDGEEITQGIEIGGSVNIADDGSYTIFTSSTFTITFTLPLECLPQDAGCEVFEDQLNEDSDGINVWTCAPNAEICDCDVTLFEDDQTGGTWVDNEDNTLTFNNDDGSVSRFAYCADANTMSVFASAEDNNGEPLQLEMDRIIGGD